MCSFGSRYSLILLIEKQEGFYERFYNNKPPVCLSLQLIIITPCQQTGNET